MDYSLIKTKDDLKEYGHQILEDCAEEINMAWEDVQYCNGYKGDSSKFYIVETWSTFESINSVLESKIPNISELLPIRDKDYPSDWFDYLSNSNWGFSDEYIKCVECGTGLSRYEYYGTPDWELVGDEYICKDCLEKKEDLKDWFFNEQIVNHYSKSGDFFSEEYLEQKGFHKLQENDVGWYSNCDNTKPKEIFDKLRTKFDVVFRIDETHQWHTAYSTWVKEKAI